jgi:hypothetical protein
MHSGRDFAWLYPRQDQTCFLDGHVRAFAHFGAAPRRGAQLAPSSDAPARDYSEQRTSRHRFRS